MFSWSLTLSQMKWPSLFVPTASSLHGSSTLWTVPFSFWCFCQPNASIMEPFYRAILVITAHHLTIGYLITDAISWFIWVISPIDLTIWIGFWYYCCLLRDFLYNSWWWRTRWQGRGGGGRGWLLAWRLVVVFALSPTPWVCCWWTGILCQCSHERWRRWKASCFPGHWKLFSQLKVIIFKRFITGF